MRASDTNQPKRKKSGAPMGPRVNKLELTWINKDQRLRLEPRVLIERKDLSVGPRQSSSSAEEAPNLLIHGDNLLSLKALEQQFAGKVKCIYIDPPYNTGSAFEHYDDGVEHSIWLSLMRERLELLRRLLHSDGIIFVQIDDREVAYLQVLMDEVFGRSNRMNLITVKMSEVSGVKMAHVDKRLPKLKEFILVYGKRPDVSINPIRVTKPPEKLEKYLKYYSNIIENPEEPPEQWSIVKVKQYLSERGLPTTKAAIRQFQLQERHRIVYRTNNKTLAGLTFPTETAKVTSATGLEYIWWEGKQMLFLADYCEEYLGDLWTDISTINLNKEGGVDFRNGKKPEALIRRVIEMASEPGDLILDSFAGSGTTAAVAHKLGRRWITIEMGDQCVTHAQPRLERVVAGEDKGGISGDVGWTGGGAFRFYELAPSLMRRDHWGQLVVSDAYNLTMLAKAVCKLKGYTFAPHESEFWNHGFSTETDHIYVTDQSLTRDQLRFISDSVGSSRTLLVCCRSWRGDAGEFGNLTVEKLRESILGECEWNRDDYRLNVHEAQLATTEPTIDMLELDPCCTDESSGANKSGEQS